MKSSKVVPGITTERPVKGQIMKVRGKDYKITRVWPFGTVDVISLCGNFSNRVTGLNFL